MVSFKQISLSPEASGEAYYPFLSAVEKQIIDPENIAAPLNDPAGVIIANGRIPNGYKNAGVVDNRGSIWAYDFAAIESVDNGRRLFIMPSVKDAVVHGERFADEGAVTLMNAEGHIKIPALVIKNEWIAKSLGRDSSIAKLGQLSIVLCGGLHRFDAVNVDDSGVIEAKSFIA